MGGIWRGGGALERKSLVPRRGISQECEFNQSVHITHMRSFEPVGGLRLSLATNFGRVDLDELIDAERPDAL